MISLNVPVDNLEIPECLICRNIAIPINSTLCFKDLIYLSSHVDDGRWRYPLSCVNTTLDEKARFSIAFCSGNLINKFKKSQLLFDCL